MVAVPAALGVTLQESPSGLASIKATVSSSIDHSTVSVVFAGSTVAVTVLAASPSLKLSDVGARVMLVAGTFFLVTVILSIITVVFALNQ